MKHLYRRSADIPVRSDARVFRGADKSSHASSRGASSGQESACSGSGGVQPSTFSFQLSTFLAVLLLGLCLPARAALYNFTGPFNNNGAGNPAGLIPDNSIIGLTDSHSISGLGSVITDVKVTLNLSGGFNGDLYCYLRLNDSPLVVLLDRVGVTAVNSDGYADTGFLVTLTADPSAHDIHFYQDYSHSYNGDGKVTGTWQADGRTDPLSNTRGSLSDYNGLNPNGTWTIFFADRSPGDESTLVGWSLQITDVPEPVSTALLVFGAFGAVGAWVSWKRKSARS